MAAHISFIDFPEAFNLYDIDKNGFITMKKMTDMMTDIISSMVENSKDEDMPEKRVRKRFLSDGNG